MSGPLRWFIKIQPPEFRGIFRGMLRFTQLRRGCHYEFKEETLRGFRLREVELDQQGAERTRQYGCRPCSPLGRVGSPPAPSPPRPPSCNNQIHFDSIQQIQL